MTAARVIALVGLVPVLLGVWLSFAQHRRISLAVPVDARVLTSERKISRDSKGRTKEYAHIRYRYQHEGEPHESDVITPIPLHLSPDADHMLELYPEGAAVTAWIDPARPSRAFLYKHHSFVPYLFIVMGAPVLALAAGLATGGVRHAKSGEAEHADPVRQGDGWWAVTAFRPYMALRASAIAGAVVISAFALPPLAHYLSVAEPPHPGAIVLALVAMALVARLSWGAFVRGWAGGKLDEAHLFVKPDVPRAGVSFAVRVTQTAKSPVTIAGVDVTVECIRRETKLVNRKTRTTRTRAILERARIGESRPVGVGEPYVAEHVFALPSGPASEGGDHFLEWRVYVRTRIAGPDYRTHFAFPIR